MTQPLNHMRSKLSVEMQQKVDDEDDRIAKAVAKREKKQENEEAAKQQKELIANLLMNTGPI